MWDVDIIHRCLDHRVADSCFTIVGFTQSIAGKEGSNTSLSSRMDGWAPIAQTVKLALRGFLTE